MNYHVAGGWGRRARELVWMERELKPVSSAQSPSPSPAAAVPPGQEAVLFISQQIQEEAGPVAKQLRAPAKGRVLVVPAV